MNGCVYNSPCRSWASSYFWETSCPHPCPPWPPPCWPKQGELIRNPSFELDFACWTKNGHVKLQDQIPDTGHNAHQGNKAVALGLSSGGFGSGYISQTIEEGLCPGVGYQFSFFMSPHSYPYKFDLSYSPCSGDADAGKYGNWEVKATLVFLDQYLNELTEGKKEILIPQDSLAMANVWTYYRTVAVAPMYARGAYIKIEITEDGAPQWEEHVHIDDVSVVAL
ncbi:MAG: hypothetical protein U9N81_11310 [Bacillota bacterium]|nr:hypothetical protein [Bacillota bacterium]